VNNSLFPNTASDQPSQAMFGSGTWGPEGKEVKKDCPQVRGSAWVSEPGLVSATGEVGPALYGTVKTGKTARGLTVC
jgi:hypothetical protein